jgi:outer membrane immunogenic protein
MNKVLFGAGLLALAAAIQPAAAADLRAPVLKAPPMVEVWSWTGFYVGVNAGYSWGDSDTTLSFFNNNTGVLLSSSGSSFNMNGWVAGGQVGYNWQNGNWVFGIEADMQATGQDGDGLFTCAPTGLCNNLTFGPALNVPVTAGISQSLEWLATVRARLGWTVAPTVLAYVTGGLAIGQIDTDLTVNGVNGLGLVPAFFSFDKTKLGWTVGGGIEARISGNWTAKIEYLYVDLGSVSGTAVDLTNIIPIRVGYTSDITDNIVRVGLNYKFGGPIVARY